MNVHSLFYKGPTVKNSDKRSKIMKVALELLAEHGFHRVSMSMIAGKANVAVGTIYIYFANKDKLIEELFLDLERKIVKTLLEGYPAESAIRDQFIFVTKKILFYFLQNAIQFRYIEQYINSPYGVMMHRDRLLGKVGREDMFINLFAEGVAKQIIKNIPVAVLFSVSFAPLIFLVRDHILGFITLDDVLIDKVTEACWDGIKR